MSESKPLETSAESEVQKPNLCLDFDGVIHLYSKGWQDGTIYDGMVPGFLEWAAEAQKYFKLVIYSSRSSTDAGRLAMGKWLAIKMHEWLLDKGGTRQPVEFTMSAEKPAAFLTIDDRAIQFQGRWGDRDLKPERLMYFRPWNDTRR
jgi:hypothetical protein